MEPSGVDGDVHASAHTLSSGKRERGFQLDTDDPKGHLLALPVPSHPAGRARGSTGPGGLEGWSKDRGLPRDWGAAKPPGGRRTQPVLGRERQVSGWGPCSWCLHPWAPRANKGFGLPACAPTPGSLISHLGCGGAVCRRLVSEAGIGEVWPSPSWTLRLHAGLCVPEFSPGHPQTSLEAQPYPGTPAPGPAGRVFPSSFAVQLRGPASQGGVRGPGSAPRVPLALTTGHCPWGGP